MKAASNASYGYTEEPLVSSDVIGITYGSLFDATQTMVMDMGNGYSQVQVCFLGMTMKTHIQANG